MSKLKITKRQCNLIELICSMTEESLKKSLENALNHYYDKENLIISDKYICAKGDIPVGLVAHLDTVHKFPAYEMYHDPFKKVMWSPYGIGADDRAGVFSILEILRAGYRPSVIFCCQEEVGGIGASYLAFDYEKPFADMKYLIELDRQGKDDSVYYKCDNKDFEEMINSFGFKTAYGSFSDISIIAPQWGISAVNLSIGYYDEHSIEETWHYEETFETIEKVYKILEFAMTDDKEYEYISGRNNIWDMIAYGDLTNICECCGEEVAPQLTISIVDTEGILYLCPDCAAKYASFCDKCNEPYISLDRHICGGCTV